MDPAKSAILKLTHYLLNALGPAKLVKEPGQVGEWLKPTDCKSVTPCELRRFESFPVHHEFTSRCSSVGRASVAEGHRFCSRRAAGRFGRCSSVGRARPW